MTRIHHNTMALALVACVAFGLGCVEEGGPSAQATACNLALKIVSPDSQYGKAFGSSVAIDGDRIVAGDGFYDYGAAYSFRFNGSTWVDEQPLIPANTTKTFGDSIALDGDTAVVGAPIDRNLAFREAGSAFVFRFTGGAWVEEQRLLASDGWSGHLFGSAVSVDGNRLAVGASHNSPNATPGGAVYIFEFDGRSWVETQKIAASNSSFLDAFGDDIALHGTHLAVSGAGVVYTYEYAMGIWGNEQIIPAMEFSMGSVDLKFDRLIVGAPGDSLVTTGDEAGAAYVYRHDGSGWVFEQGLVASDAMTDDRFGTDVAISGRSIAVTSNVWFSSFVGAVYRFKFDGVTWSESDVHEAADGELGDAFGAAVAIDGLTVVTGSPLDSDPTNTGNGLEIGSAHVIGCTAP